MKEFYSADTVFLTFL